MEYSEHIEEILSLQWKQTSKGNEIGCCLINTGERSLEISEFMDNELFTMLESLLVQFNKKYTPDTHLSIIFPHGDHPNNTAIQTIIQLFDIPITLLDPKLWANPQNNIHQGLGALLNTPLAQSMTLLEEMNLGAGCLNSIIDYLGLATDSTNNGQFVLSEYRIMDRMRLDMAALRALNAFPTGHGGDSGDSLCSLIDKCMTLGGSRLLANWISQPLQSVQGIYIYIYIIYIYI